MISRSQLHTARLSLDLSVNALAKLAGIAPNTVWAIEEGADYKQSSMEALETALRDRGVLFAGQHVGVRMVWAEGLRPESAQVRESVLAVLNAHQGAGALYRFGGRLMLTADAREILEFADAIGDAKIASHAAFRLREEFAAMRLRSTLSYGATSSKLSARWRADSSKSRIFSNKRLGGERTHEPFPSLHAYARAASIAAKRAVQ